MLQAANLVDLRAVERGINLWLHEECRIAGYDVIQAQRMADFMHQDVAESLVICGRIEQNRKVIAVEADIGSIGKLAEGERAA